MNTIRYKRATLSSDFMSLPQNFKIYIKWDRPPKKFTYLSAGTHLAAPPY